MPEKFTITKILDFEIDSAYCTLIKYSNVTFLIDCGLSFDFDTSKYTQNHDILKTVDFIIITSSEIQHSAGLCFLLNKHNQLVI